MQHVRKSVVLSDCAKRLRVGVQVGGGPLGRYRYREYGPESIPSSTRCKAICERQRQTQGTEAPGCVDAAPQPLGGDVHAHGEGRRRPRGVARVGDPHKAWSA